MPKLLRVKSEKAWRFLFFSVLKFWKGTYSVMTGVKERNRLISRGMKSRKLKFGSVGIKISCKWGQCVGFPSFFDNFDSKSNIFKWSDLRRNALLTEKWEGLPQEQKNPPVFVWTLPKPQHDICPEQCNIQHTCHEVDAMNSKCQYLPLMQQVSNYPYLSLRALKTPVSSHSAKTSFRLGPDCP